MKNIKKTFLQIFGMILPSFLKSLVLFPYYKLKYKSLNLKSLDIRIGTGCHLEQYVTLYQNVILVNADIGSYTYISGNSSLTNVIIARFCSIGPNVLIGVGMHPTKTFVSTHPSFYSMRGQSSISFADNFYFTETSDVRIGNDVWIGARAIILDGIKIGDGAIIGAGSVVNKDVPDYAIVGGVPAKLIRYRFSKEQIEFLKHIKWWDKDIDWIRSNYKLFQDIGDFTNHFEKRLNNK